MAQPTLVDDEIRWNLTPQGRVVALEEVGRRTEVKRLQKARYSVNIQELYAGAWWDMIQDAIRIGQIEKYRPKDLPEEEFEKNLRSYSEQIKPVLAGLWPTLLHDYVQGIGLILALMIAFRALFPSPLDEKSRTKLSRLMSNVGDSILKSLDRQTAEILLANFNYLEALVVLAKATEEGKVNRQEWEGKPADELIRVLHAKGLLQVIKEPNDSP